MRKSVLNGNGEWTPGKKLLKPKIVQPQEAITVTHTNEELEEALNLSTGSIQESSREDKKKKSKKVLDHKL